MGRRAGVALAAIVAAAVAGAAVVGAAAPGGEPAPPPPPPQFRVINPQATPHRAYFAGPPVEITFGLAAPAPLALQVDIVRDRTDRPVRRITLTATPAETELVSWDGLTGGGKVAPEGGYRIRIRAADGRVRRGGRFTLRSHAYPIRGPHADRGAIGTFGVARNGGRRHEGFDVNAPCGTPLVAARGGRVVRAGLDPVLHGNVVIIRGAQTQRDYWYSHMKNRTRLRVGDTVRTGQRIGSIGDTGNARTIGCHLHFEIHSRGRPIDPAPELHDWDRWS